MFLSFWDYDYSVNSYVDVRLAVGAPWVSTENNVSTGYSAEYRWEIVGANVVYTAQTSYINSFGHPAQTYYRATCPVVEIQNAPRVLRDGLYVQSIKWTEQ